MCVCTLKLVEMFDPSQGCHPLHVPRSCLSRSQQYIIYMYYFSFIITTQCVVDYKNVQTDFDKVHGLLGIIISSSMSAVVVTFGVN